MTWKQPTKIRMRTLPLSKMMSCPQLPKMKKTPKCPNRNLNWLFQTMKIRRWNLKHSLFFSILFSCQTDYINYSPASWPPYSWVTAAAIHIARWASRYRGRSRSLYRCHRWAGPWWPRATGGIATGTPLAGALWDAETGATIHVVSRTSGNCGWLTISSRWWWWIRR